MMAGLSEYELKRLQNIKRNADMYVDREFQLLAIFVLLKRQPCHVCGGMPKLSRLITVL